MLRLDLDAELAAAVSVAANVGLGIVTPTVLHLGNHTTVRLGAWPVAARIASGSSFDFSAGAIASELKLARDLARQHAPSVRPTSNPAPGPYIEDHCVVTLWEFVDGRPVASQRDEFEAAKSLQRLHAALASISCDLPSFVTKVESCGSILSDRAEAPKLAPADRLFLRTVYRTLRGRLDHIHAPSRALHGDTHLGNVLMTGSGAIWMDLEAACLGPLEWDVVNLPSSTWSMFPGLDLALMRLLADTRSLCLAVWCWAEFDRSEDSAQTAIRHLRDLKARF